MEARTERYTQSVEKADHRARASAPSWNERVHRFSVLERVLHWIMAAAGIVCILTGLGWFAQGFHFLLVWFGGGEWARLIHSVSGIVTAVCAVWLIGVLWFRHVFRFIPEDWRWLKVSGGYLRRQAHPLVGGASRPQPPDPNGDIPAQGFYNGGQKLWGILAVILSVVFLGSGLVIWSPELFHDFLGLQPFSVPVMLAMYVIHDVAFIVFAPMVFFHIYLSSALNPGTFTAMSGGDVSRLWAWHHHRLWYREVAGEDRLGEE